MNTQMNIYDKNWELITRENYLQLKEGDPVKFFGYGWQIHTLTRDDIIDGVFSTGQGGERNHILVHSTYFYKNL